MKLKSHTSFWPFFHPFFFLAWFLWHCQQIVFFHFRECHTRVISNNNNNSDNNNYRNYNCSRLRHIIATLNLTNFEQVFDGFVVFCCCHTPQKPQPQLSDASNRKYVKNCMHAIIKNFACFTTGTHTYKYTHTHTVAHTPKKHTGSRFNALRTIFLASTVALPLPALTARIDFHIRISVRRRRHLFFRLQTANGNINVNVERQQRRRRCRRSLLNLNYAHQSESNGTVAFASSFNAAVNVGSAVRCCDGSAILCTSECALSLTTRSLDAALRTSLSLR